MYAKSVDYKFKKNDDIKSLNQISSAHSERLIQIQQQLIENQQDIDILRGQIQNLQHEISKMTIDQKNSCHTIDDNTITHNKVKNSKFISSDNIELEYKKAVMLVLKKKEYDQAIQAFQNFIKNFPKSDYQPNAHYWLGQLYYNKNKKDDALYHFALVVKNYPKSSKASDALLKIGVIMQEMNQKEKARIVYKQVGKLYPNSESAKQAQKRLLNL